MAPKYRNICFTSYTYPSINCTNVVYYVHGEEDCPSTARLHWQGFIQLKNNYSVKGIQKILGCENAHIENARGTAQEASDYCKKDGRNIVEWGEIRHQGERSDLTRLKDQIISGETTTSQLLFDVPAAMHFYGRTLEKIQDEYMLSVFRNEMTFIHWIYSEKTGIGKSHYAFMNYSHKTHYNHTFERGGWWDGYRQQETVIFNEYRGQLELFELLLLADKFPHNVPRRGRPPIPFVSKLIIITCPFHPSHFYGKASELGGDDIAQLYRRMRIYHKISKTEEIEVDQNGTEVLKR